MVITELTRNFLKSWLFAPLKKLVKSGVFSGSKIEYFVVLSVSSFQKFLEEMRNYIHGELSEWSKVQHSKSCRSLSGVTSQTLDTSGFFRFSTLFQN